MNAKKALEYMIKNYVKNDYVLQKEGIRKPTYHVSYPQLKIISQVILKSDPFAFLDSNPFEIYELEILHTYVLGNLKDLNLALKYFKTFAPNAKEWSVVDSLCQKFKISRKHPKEVFELLESFAIIGDEYMQRIVAVTLLSHFFNDAYIDASIALLDRLNHQGYYLKMAKAWAYATMMVKYPQKCLEYLYQNRLDTWTHNKGIQKMIESYRISDEMKTKLKLLKK